MTSTSGPAILTPPLSSASPIKATKATAAQVQSGVVYKTVTPPPLPASVQCYKAGAL